MRPDMVVAGGLLATGMIFIAGGLEIVSRLGEGTTVRVRVPAVRHSAES